MVPEDFFLALVVFLAGLFFITGSIQAFGDARPASRQRRRRRRRKPSSRRRPVPSALSNSQENVARATPNTISPSPAQPMPVGETPMTREVVWPARPPVGSTVARQVESAQSFDGVQPPPLEVESGKIVVHYANGKVIKGFSHDFYPNKPRFHLLPAVAGFAFSDEAIEVRMEELKGVFFVRDFAGDPRYNERKYFAQGEQPAGRKVEVSFPDGEVMVGSTMGYDRQRSGFFLIPADPKSNNLRVFVVFAGIRRVRFL